MVQPTQVVPCTPAVLERLGYRTIVGSNKVNFNKLQDSHWVVLEKGTAMVWLVFLGPIPQASVVPKIHFEKKHVSLELYCGL